MSHADAMSGKLWSIMFAKLSAAQDLLFTTFLIIEANFVDNGLITLGNAVGFPIQYGIFGGATRVLSCHLWTWSMELQAMAISRIPI
jgi:hypothetical protein